jgi:hypothetical protein
VVTGAGRATEMLLARSSVDDAAAAAAAAIDMVSLSGKRWWVDGWISRACGFWLKMRA